MSEIFDRTEYRERTVENLVLLPITDRQYLDGMECLPPVVWNAKGFLLGEPCSHSADGHRDTFRPFFTINDTHFYKGDGPVTIETFLGFTRAQVDAAIERGKQ